MADTYMTILSQGLFRMSFLVHQAELQLMGVLSSLWFSWNLCNINSSNIVLMDLGFSLIIRLNKAFLLRPSKLYEFITGSVRINSRPTKRPTDLAIVLHINLKIFEMCKTRISSRQCLVGLEFMRVAINLSFYSFSDDIVGRRITISG